MAQIEMKDREGQVFRCIELNGRRYPTFAVDSLKHVMEISAMPDDVLLITYPKSGTHWISEIIRFLVHGTTELPIAEKVVHFLDIAEREIINELPKSCPRYLSTHFHADALSPDFLRQKSKIIYATRDPRDALVSYYNHIKNMERYMFEGKWDNFLPFYLEGHLSYNSWFEHTKGWEKCIKEHPDNPFLVLSYEGLKQDPLSNIRKINNFIGTNLSEEFLKEVEMKTMFKAMHDIREKEQSRDLAFYRKGQVGDWKNNFTVAQSEMFNELFEKEMIGTDAYKMYSHTVG